MLKQRIAILQQGNIISKEVADFTLAVIDALNRDYPEINNEKAEMFTTHLCMAAQRTLDCKAEEPLGAAIMDEILVHPAYQQACSFLETIKELSCVEFSKTELDFLIVHLCNLFT